MGKLGKGSAKERMAKLEGSVTDFTKPLDLSDYGGDNDPCFGKLWDLSVSECKRCGDSGFCSVIFAQNQHYTRESIEKVTPMRDLQEAKILATRDEAKAFLLKQKKLGVSITIAVSRASRRYPILQKNLLKEFYGH